MRRSAPLRRLHMHQGASCVVCKANPTTFFNNAAAAIHPHSAAVQHIPALPFITAAPPPPSMENEPPASHRFLKSFADPVASSQPRTHNDDHTTSHYDFIGDGKLALSDRLDKLAALMQQSLDADLNSSTTKNELPARAISGAGPKSPPSRKTHRSPPPPSQQASSSALPPFPPVLTAVEALQMAAAGAPLPSWTTEGFFGSDPFLNSGRMMSVTGTNSTSSSIWSSKTFLENENGEQQSSQAYDRLLAGEEAALTNADGDEIVDFLSRSPLKRTRSASSIQQQQHQGNTASAKQLTSAPPSPQGDAATANKASLYLQALNDCCAALDAARVPHFLACGTALGLRREGRFIPHDTDIDLGILYEEIATLASTSPTSNATKTTRDDEAFQAAEAIARFITLTASKEPFANMIVFDVLGEIEKGFQLRLRHTNGVMMDINLYYVAEEGSETKLALTSTELKAKAARNEDTSDALYVWTATHYEKSAARKHNMYRYRYRWPLVLEAGQSFSEYRTLTQRTFRVPDEEYLEQYFGLDWRTPKVYGYEEALAMGEYKNVIPE